MCCCCVYVHCVFEFVCVAMCVFVVCVFLVYVLCCSLCAVCVLKYLFVVVVCLLGLCSVVFNVSLLCCVCF